MLKKFVNQGVNSDISADNIRKVILSNKINLLLIGLFIIVAIFDLIDVFLNNKEFKPGFLGIYILILLCTLHLFLTTSGKFWFSIILLFFDIPLVLLFFAPIIDNSWTSYYFWGPYAPITFSVIPYFFFTKKHELKWLFLILGFYVLLVIGYDLFLLSLNSTDQQLVEIIKKNYIFYKLIPLLIFIFVNLSLFNSFGLTRKYLVKINRINKKLESQKIQLEKSNTDLIKLNATKDKFFKIIGHDLRNPMSLVVQFSKLLENNIERYDSNKLKEIISLLNKSSTQGMELLSDLLTWAQSQTNEISFEPFSYNLKELIESSIKLKKLSASKKHITLENTVDNTLYVLVDKNMFMTIIRNLISNAIKFTPKNGRITMSSSIEGKKVRLSVNDTGIGIDKQDIGKLFNIETNISTIGTENEKGSGLGLIICKEFVSRHKGEIWVESEPGKGSNFLFTIPLTKP